MNTTVVQSRTTLQAEVDTIAGEYLVEWTGLGLAGTFDDARVAATLALIISQPG